MEQPRVHLQSRGPDLSTLIRRITAAVGIPPTAVADGGRSRAVVRVRDGLAYLWLAVLVVIGDVLRCHVRHVKQTPSALPHLDSLGA